MDPKGHDGTLESAADLMVSPDLGGELLPAEQEAEVEEKVDEPEAESAEQEPEQEPEEDQPEDEEPEAEAPDLDHGDDDVDDQEEPDAQDDTQRYKVKVDGTETEVTLEELKQGYSGQQYVQQGMQEAKRIQKEAEGIYNSLQAERRQVADFVQSVRAGVKPPPVEPDRELFKTDPIAYMEQKLVFDEEAAQYTAQMNQLEQVATQQTQADQHAMQAHMTSELQQLQAIDPEFRTQEGAEKIRETMLTKGKELYGYEPQEIGQIVDHRALLVLRDAIRYRAIKSGKKQAQQKVQQKIAKVGNKKRVSSAQSRRRKQKDRLKQSGSIDDALGLLFQK